MATVHWAAYEHGSTCAVDVALHVQVRPIMGGRHLRNRFFIAFPGELDGLGAWADPIQSLYIGYRRINL